MHLEQPWALWVCILPILLCLASCGDDSNVCEPSEALKVSSMSQRFEALLDSGETCHEVGLNIYRLELVEQMGASSETFDVTLSLWMPAHGHGSDRVPTVKRVELNTFTVSNVSFTMPGLWALTFDIDAETFTDKVVFEVNVP